jgi:molybdopterin-guanine dinucleotide biosynthesis protein A
MKLSKKVSAIILAGGQGNRMGNRDKGLIEKNGSPLISHVIKQISSQVDDISLNCNRHIDEYKELGFAVITDQLPGFQGPLAGMHASLIHAKHDVCLICPCDMPNLPSDLVARLYDALTNNCSDIAFPTCGTRRHYIPSLIRIDLLASLSVYLESGKRSVHGWYANLKVQEVDFSATEESFINVNTSDLLFTV